MSRLSKLVRELNAMFSPGPEFGDAKSIADDVLDCYAYPRDNAGIDKLAMCYRLALEEIDDLRAEIATDDELLTERDKFIRELSRIVGACGLHGDTCMPNILDRVREMKAEPKDPVLTEPPRALPGGYFEIHWSDGRVETVNEGTAKHLAATCMP